MAKRFADVLGWHRSAYPGMKARDWYKLVHQSVYGVGHLVRNARDARSQFETGLRSELRSLPRLRRRELLLEPVDFEAGLVRVNLRPYQTRAGNPAQLARALARTARQVSGTRAQLEQRLKLTLRWLKQYEPETAVAFQRLVMQAEKQGYPVMRHSAEYRRKYRPAYRVVLRKLVVALPCSRSRSLDASPEI